MQCIFLYQHQIYHAINLYSILPFCPPGVHMQTLMLKICITHTQTPFSTRLFLCMEVRQCYGGRRKNPQRSNIYPCHVYIDWGDKRNVSGVGEDVLMYWNQIMVDRIPNVN